MYLRHTEEQEIAADLIFCPQTTARLAWVFGETEEAIVQVIEELFEKGIITPLGDLAWGDVRCTQCGAEYQGEYELPRDPCQQCGGWLEDICKWTYIGGPVSKALAAVV
jgi:hypothetical protein